MCSTEVTVYFLTLQKLSDIMNKNTRFFARSHILSGSNILQKIEMQQTKKMGMEFNFIAFETKKTFLDWCITSAFETLYLNHTTNNKKGRQEMHLLVFHAGGHLNFDVFTGFFACRETSGVLPATLPVKCSAYLAAFIKYQQWLKGFQLTFLETIFWQHFTKQTNKYI